MTNQISLNESDPKDLDCYDPILDGEPLRHFDYYENESEKTGINILTLIRIDQWGEKMRNPEYRKIWEEKAKRKRARKPKEKDK
ncbi:hypothetical protein [Chroococcus sp. FPU101]|uniref:hypothetical protein n=1 Tax=Chroococcus sp. FPU101 TaxID=1974212 RepID=UPI001A90B347|nr:hypothetical protein [Chroococcus sp. FPU101]